MTLPLLSKARFRYTLRVNTSPLDLREFFLVTLPGFEDLVCRELGEWFPGLEVSRGHGGVTVMAPLETGLAMNLVLKIPTRVLLRAATFRCKDFPKLFQKIAQFPWEEILDPASLVEVEVSSSRSRLKMKKRIAETCLKGWRARQKKFTGKPDVKKPAILFVRFADDECTLSLDTSGERLHKRGSRKFVGEAPLRETIAAALIQLTGGSLAAGDSRPVELIDPMMGSGTFLLEAATRDEQVSARDFAFQSFKHEKIADPKLNSERPRIVALTGFEMDKKTLTAAKANLRGLEKGRQVQLIAQDFFKAEPLHKVEGRQRWVIANPPYGERLEVQEPLADFYAKLFAACESLAQPDRACFILPSKAVRGRFKLPPSWKVLEKRSFSNGGIPVVAFLFGRIDG